MMVIARGSFSNIDFDAASIRTGHSQVRAFNLNNRTGVYDYTTEGLRLGWGLRNEVGLGEHPLSGGIWGVENSADQQTRMGVDIHTNNPGEELNFFGYLNGTEYADQGTNFGYPWCFSAWGVDELPDNGDLCSGLAVCHRCNVRLKQREQNRSVLRRPDSSKTWSSKLTWLHWISNSMTPADKLGSLSMAAGTGMNLLDTSSLSLISWRVDSQSSP